MTNSRGGDACLNIYLEQDYDDDISSITSCDSLRLDLDHPLHTNLHVPSVHPELTLSLPLELRNQRSAKRSLEEAAILPPLPLPLHGAPKRLKTNMGGGLGPAARTSFVYSSHEIIGMLNVIEKVRPKNFESWALVQVIHESFWPQHGRSVDSLKRKFRELYNYKQDIQQHPKVSAMVIVRAKCLHTSLLVASKGGGSGGSEVKPPYNLFLQAMLKTHQGRNRIKYSSTPKPKKPIHVPCPLYEPIPMVIEVPSIHSVDNSNASNTTQSSSPQEEKHPQHPSSNTTLVVGPSPPFQMDLARQLGKNRAVYTPPLC